VNSHNILKSKKGFFCPAAQDAVPPEQHKSVMHAKINRFDVRFVHHQSANQSENKHEKTREQNPEDCYTSEGKLTTNRQCILRK